jgi:acyl-CoA thioesterase FadM
MGRPISSDYLLGRKLLTGVTNPSGLGVSFELDGTRVYAVMEVDDKLSGKAKVLPPGATQGVIDDCAHATLSALKKRIGVTRESRVRFLKPLYKGEPMRVEGSILKESADLFTIAVRLIDKKLQACVEGEIEVFGLSADQVRRMTPDGMVPPELKRYLP